MSKLVYIFFLTFYVSSGGFELRSIFFLSFLRFFFNLRVFARVNQVTSASLRYPLSVFNQNSTLKR